MFNAFQKIGLFFRSLSGWIAVITVGAPTIWLYVLGKMDGYPTILVVYITFAGLAVGLCAAYYLLKLIDLCASYFGKRGELSPIADQLQELIDAGYEQFDINYIAGVWSGDQATMPFVYNPKLKRLKGAVNKGKIKIIEMNGDKANRKTIVDINDVIKEFRKGGL